MNKKIFKHPVGNIKIFIIKNFSILISNLVLFFLSLIIKIKKNESEIIISRALYAPWKKNNLFRVFFKKISHLTLLDKVRSYTLWYLTESLKNDMHNLGYTDFNIFQNVNEKKLNYYDYLNNKSIEIINTFYHLDFILFNYDKI